MSVDTHLKQKNLSRYHATQTDNVVILLSERLGTLTPPDARKRG